MNKVGLPDIADRPESPDMDHPSTKDGLKSKLAATFPFNTFSGTTQKQLIDAACAAVLQGKIEELSSTFTERQQDEYPPIYVYIKRPDGMFDRMSKEKRLEALQKLIEDEDDAR